MHLTDIFLPLLLLIIYLKMSNSRIFGNPKTTQSNGRSANLAGNMLKRSPIFTHIVSQKQQSSPFANYNCRSVESFYSSESIPQSQEERLTIDAVRQLIKSEFSKGRSEDENKKTIMTLQAQLKDIRQKIGEVQSQNSRQLQALKQTLRLEMKQEVVKVGGELDQQISGRLRLFFQKANVQLKKDILKVASLEFLSVGYGDELQNHLEAIEENLQQVRSFMKTKQMSSQDLQKKINSINISDTLDNKLNKMEKEADSIKKSMSQYHARMKHLQEWNSTQISNQIAESLRELNLNIEALSKEQLHLKRPIQDFQQKSCGYDSAFNQLQHKIEDTDKNCEEVRKQLKDLLKLMSSQQLQKRRSQQYKDQINQQVNFQTSFIIANNSSVYNQHRSQKKCSDSEVSDFSAIATSIQYEDHKKAVYQVDSEGFLMDGQKKYLLTGSGSMIRLEGEQIKALLQSKAIQVIDF